MHAPCIQTVCIQQKDGRMRVCAGKGTKTQMVKLILGQPEKTVFL